MIPMALMMAITLWLIPLFGTNPYYYNFKS